MAGALDGVVVLDFGQYIAGPLAAMLLADQGAEVIRVDPPGGPMWDTPANQVWNRGKQRISLDLKVESDRRIALSLVERADVLIENFRPGVMDRLGLGPVAALEANPDLVYCALPGFGSNDPRRGVAGWESVVQAAAAISVDDSGEPAASAVPLPSVFAAFYAATSITMALFARLRGDRGQSLEIPLFDAALGAHGFRVQRVHGAPPVPHPDTGLQGMHMWMGRHECQDGRYVFFHPGNMRAREFIESICGTGWEDWPDLRERIDALFKQRTAAEWEQLGHDFETEVALFRTTGEWLREEHAREAGLVISVIDPVFGQMLQPGVQVHLDASPGRPGQVASAPDEQRDAVLERANGPLPDREPRHAPTLAAALKDVRVLELSQQLAGPTCGRTMVEFGADVIKLDNPLAPPLPAAWVPTYQAFEIDVNRGKRSILVDLHTDDGKEIFWRLAERSDVIIQNFRPGVLDKLGIGYSAVKSRCPSVVFASINAYGAAGPWAGLPGHEHLGQAVSGMAERFGGDGPPTLQVVRAPTDYGTGILGGFAIGLALIDRERTGKGQEVNVALAATAATLQAPFLYDYEGRIWDEPRGLSLTGSGVSSRLYRASDGWVALGCRESQLPAVVRALGAEPTLFEPSAIEALLETEFAKRTATDLVATLTSAGVGAHSLCTLTDLKADPTLLERGAVISRFHEGLGQVDHLAPVPRLSGTPTQVGSPRRPPGSDAEAILDESGVDASLADLVAAGVVFSP